MLILDDPNTWPKHITKKLNKRSVLKLLKQQNYFNTIQHERDIQDICAYVKEHAQSVRVAAYHCTKQIPERPYSETGLRVLHLDEHHRELLETMRHHRPDIREEYWERVRDILAEWRVGEKETREGRLDFCARRCLVIEDDDGTEKFFKYFGGEAGYMPFIYDKHPDVEEILEQIGEPVVVEVRLWPADLGIWQDWLGPTLVGHYAHSINPNFLDEDYVTQIKRNVEPCDVIRVYPHAVFMEMVTGVSSTIG